MKNNKKLGLGIGCGVLVIALIVGIILITGGSGKQPEPTNPTNTNPSGNVTEPSGTEPNVTEPGIPEYTDPDEPSNPDENPDEPSNPDENPDEPSNPDDKPYEPLPPDPTYDFTGITPGNLTAEQWKSWGSAQRQAFFDTYDIANLSLDDKYNFYLQTQFGGYDCGFEGHHCAAQEHHDQVMADMAEGCPHYGGNDCAAFYARNMMGFTQIDFCECPQYDVTKDPVYYCQTCGLPYNADSGKEVCNWFVVDTNCDYCGEPVKANQCHWCIKP